MEAPAGGGQFLAESPGAVRFHRALFAWFLVWWVSGLLVEWFRWKMPAGWEWVDGAFLTVAAATGLAGLARRLPVQNVVALAVGIGVLAVGLEAVGVLTGVPFGRYRYSESLGYRLGGVVPWPIAGAWVAVLVACRGTARVLLEPGRGSRNHGWHVTALAGLLAVWMDLALEPFAVLGRGFWHWEPIQGGLTWYGVPWTNFVGWWLGAVGIQAATLGWWLRKRPGPDPAEHPAVGLWLLLMAFFAVANGKAGRWAAVVVGGGGVLAIGGWVAYSGRWRKTVVSPS